MKKLLLCVFGLFLLSSFSFAQTTAMDWTKEDCNGISHNLFDELDSGQVILCEYVMQCATCISAANYLNEIYQDYEISNPGKVKYYAIDWKNAFTCFTFQEWATNLSCTLFLDGYDEVLYYGGMGMPTNVVIGGSDHHVYYSQLGYLNSKDNFKIREAIDSALNSTGIDVNNTEIVSLNMFPNPAAEFATINYSLEKAASVSLEIVNALGEKIKIINSGIQTAGKNHYTLNTGALNNGFYFLRLKLDTESKVIKFSVMN